MREIVFDSSFLMAVVERPTTWFEDITFEVGPFRPVVLDCVVAELSRMSKREGRRSKVARVALEIASGFAVAKCGKKTADESIIDYSKQNRAAAATVDGEVIAALKRRGLGVITLRQGRVAVA